MEDLIGMKFGRMTVIEFAGYYKCNCRGKKALWKCKCECGNEKIVRGSCLLYGDTKSCGCLSREMASARAVKHHGFGTRLYNIWDSMRQRCNNPNNKSYYNYGGRGIKICKEWDDFNKFKEWSLSNGYDENAEKGRCTLDRIDVDGMYSPDNCRWCDMKAQSNNKRNTKYLEYNGEIKSLSQWADEIGVKYCTVWKRYSRGLPPEKILKPVK